MTEQQVIHAMEVLARLYADQYGINNPEIIITKKGEKKECSKTQ